MQVHVDSQCNKSDRMILRCEFERMQSLTGRVFDLDACCNADGSNRLCDHYCSPGEQSFLLHNCAGKHVWINPPFNQVPEFVDHYLECKTKDPRGTSACILVPNWPGPWRQRLKHMELLHVYPKGTRLFTAPNPDGTRRELPGIPWSVHVYYDRPDATMLLTERQTGNNPVMCFDGQLSGVPARILIDTGATDSFIDERFAQRT